jgi:GDP-L-fucose synthase
MVADQSFWVKHHVLVTGGSGFLGRHVVNELSRRGCKNIAVPRRKTYDLREQHAIVELLQKSRPTMIIHLAANVGGIGANMKCPGSFFYDNAVMGIQLMEYARQLDVRKLVCVGTVCAYPKFTPVPFKEEDLWIGYPEETNAPYGLAKKMLLVQAQAYRKEYGFNAVYLIPVNLYGPGDNFDSETSHVIPSLIRKFVDAGHRGQRTVLAWGSGEPSREFLYVEDAAEAIISAAEQYDSPDPVNLGSGEEITVRSLAELVAELTCYKGSIHWDVTRPDGQPRRSLNVNRAKREFGFVAKTKLRDGLTKTINWYLENLSSLSNQNYGGASGRNETA